MKITISLEPLVFSFSFIHSFIPFFGNNYWVPIRPATIATDLKGEFTSMCSDNNDRQGYRPKSVPCRVSFCHTIMYQIPNLFHLRGTY